MDLTTEVRPGANRYVSGKGILKEILQYLSNYEEVAIVTGKTAYQAFCDYYGSELPFPVHFYDGSASTENGLNIAQNIQKAQAVLAIGGGRVMDTSKVTAQALSADLILVPTLISNCAPYTPVGALYYKDLTFDKVAYFPKASLLTLVDFEFLLSTPRPYLVAGIGDTLAKWYEIEGIVRRLDWSSLPASARLGYVAAKEIYKILFDDAPNALEALSQKKVTPAFERIADTIIELSGTVGGFAGAYGHMAGAHALHNGLSLLTETHCILHSAKVAYGVLVQLAYTKDYDEITHLLPFYKACDLPIHLSELGLSHVSHHLLKPVADFAASSSETYNLIDPHVTGEKILVALDSLESLTEQTKQ